MKPEVEEILSEPTASVLDAGRVLGLGRNGSYEAVKRGEIPVVRFGHKIRVPTAWLKKIIE
jgi:excisionase family DNA binding protein